MPKRQRIDSIAAAVAVAAGAGREIVPPAHVPLDECDLPFWASVIAEYARADWTDHQLEMAAMLARSMADMAREQMTLRREGAVMTTERGTPVVNPRKAVVQMTAGAILSMRRSLALHARAQQGEARDAGKRRAAARKIETDVMDPAADDLIARPTAH